MEEKPQALSWQYIVLIVIVALLVPLVAAAPIDINRAERPLTLNDLTLSQRYDDESGLSLEYPAGWQITPLAPGQFLLANFQEASMAPPSRDNQMVVLFRKAAFADLGMPDGTNTYDLMVDISANANYTENDIVETEVNGIPGSRVHFEQDDLAIELILLSPDDSTLIIIEADTVTSTWDNASALLENILNTVTVAESTADSGEEEGAATEENAVEEEESAAPAGEDEEAIEEEESAAGEDEAATEEEAPAGEDEESAGDEENAESGEDEPGEDGEDGATDEGEGDAENE